MKWISEDGLEPKPIVLSYAMKGNIVQQLSKRILDDMMLAGNIQNLEDWELESEEKVGPYEVEITLRLKPKDFNKI